MIPGMTFRAKRVDLVRQGPQHEAATNHLQKKNVE